MANVEGSQTALQLHVPRVVAALALDEIVARTGHAGAIVYGFGERVGNLHEETLAQTLLQTKRKVIVVTIRVRRLITDFREDRVDASHKLRAPPQREYLLLGRDVVRPSHPAIHVWLRLLPEMQCARTGITGDHSPSGGHFALQCQAPAVDVRRLLLVLDNSRRQASSGKKICEPRSFNRARKCQRDPSSGCVRGKNRAGLREWRHLLNIRPQVVKHRMLVKNAKATPHRCLFISWRESESETRAEAFECRVGVEAVHCTQRRESGIQLLCLLGQVHAGIKRGLHCRDQSVFLCRNCHELVANSEIKSQ